MQHDKMHPLSIEAGNTLCHLQSSNCMDTVLETLTGVEDGEVKYS